MRRLLFCLVGVWSLSGASAAQPPSCEVPSTVWQMDGTIVTSVSSLPCLDEYWTIAGSGDLNGDGKADLVWTRPGSLVTDVAVWLMDGSTVLSSAWLPYVGHDTVLEAVADLDGDGKADLVWRDAYYD